LFCLFVFFHSNKRTNEHSWEIKRRSKSFLGKGTNEKSIVFLIILVKDVRIEIKRKKKKKRRKRTNDL